ncbi:MAG TPA: hypothetical protein PLI16_04695, partial [Bacteroidales bacterium]|nr:hypothetical protein [Bacteroidales bacterium]
MKKLITGLLLLFYIATASYAAAPAKAISDTIDVLNYCINVNLSHISTKSLSGSATLEFIPRHDNVSQVKLYLLKLNVDSIFYENNLLTTFSYNDTIIEINLPQPIHLNDTVSLTVFYHGMPQTDASGWGGFYFSAD